MEKRSRSNLKVASTGSPHKWRGDRGQLSFLTEDHARSSTSPPRGQSPAAAAEAPDRTRTQPLASEPTNASSTLSLSRFPIPPHLSSSQVPLQAHIISSLKQPDDHTTSLQAHRSKRTHFSNFPEKQTPKRTTAPQDLLTADAMDQLEATENGSNTSSSSQRSRRGTPTAATPTRPIFDDFTSAYNTILARTALLPPVPAAAPAAPSPADPAAGRLLPAFRRPSPDLSAAEALGSPNDVQVPDVETGRGVEGSSLRNLSEDSYHYYTDDAFLSLGEPQGNERSRRSEGSSSDQDQSTGTTIGQIIRQYRHGGVVPALQSRASHGDMVMSSLPVPPSPDHGEASGLSRLGFGWSPTEGLQEQSPGQGSSPSLLDPFRDPSETQADLSAGDFLPGVPHTLDARRHSEGVLRSASPARFYGLSNDSVIASSTALPGPRAMRLPAVRPLSEGFSHPAWNAPFRPQTLSGDPSLLSPYENELELQSSPGGSDQESVVEISDAPSAPATGLGSAGIIPAMFRMSAVEKVSTGNVRLVSGRQRSLSPSRSEDGESIAEEELDQQDWETVGESRPTLHTQSIAGQNSTDVTSLGRYRNIGLHPGDDRFQHSYRVLPQAADSDESILVPSYDFPGGSGFPERNVLTPPLPTSPSIFISPLPLPEDHVHPFTNTPPWLGETSADQDTPEESFTENAAVRGSTRQILFNRRRLPLSVVFEHAEDQFHGQSSDRSPAAFNRITSESSAWLDTEHGPSVAGGSELVDDILGLPLQDTTRPQSVIFTSGASVGLFNEPATRAPSPRMRPRGNSFAKQSQLGARANLTGTPEGTGMRQAGSSLVDSSSSPLPLFDANVQHPALSGLHNTPPSSLPKTYSPAARFNGSRFSASTPDSPSRRSIMSGSFREEMLAAGRAEGLERERVHGLVEPRPRTSVGRQTDLIGLELPSRVAKSTSVNARPPEESFILDVERSERTSGRLRDPTSPRIADVYRPASSIASGILRHKNTISWSCFGLCCILPPLLIIYGYGFLDPILDFTTRGEITHFSSDCKRIAKRTGSYLTGIIVFSLVLGLILIHVLPNNLPR